MRRGICVLTCLTLLLGACTTTPIAPAVPDGLWQDQAFSYDATLVTVSTDSLFALDPDLLRSLRDGKVAATHAGNRSAHLLELVFGADLKAFAYAGGHSTVAAETWQNRRGDCLSLSIMSLALARALDLPAKVQEVRVPASFDRRDGVDFLNRHVNVLVSNESELRAIGRTLPAGDIVIDFEPQIGTRRKGDALDDRDVLARFYNNLAAEHLAKGQDRLAYAHFKAAILVKPAYAASYGNLAQLYLRAGLQTAAEKALLRAVQLNDESGLALDSMHRLLLDQGREAEARVYERRLQTLREQDPYYWLGLGLVRLQQAQYLQAVAALERAQAMTRGFAEVHRYLAVAYWRSGKPHLARDQLAALSALEQGDASVALLNKKLFKSSGETTVAQ
jgi:tetratricopeptide (TPR) repeat protein